MKKSIPLCVYCNERPATTKDHVVARQFFLPPRPDNLPTVPCCDDCNARFRPHEEYICTLFATHATAMRSSPQAEALVDQKMLRWLDKRPKLRKYLITQLCPVPDGVRNVPPGVTRGFPIDSVHFKPFLEKVTKGLFFHHTHAPLPGGFTVETAVEVDSTRFDEYAESFIEHGVRPRHFEAGVFTYATLHVAEKPHHSAWLFWFYNSILAASRTAPAFKLASAHKRARAHSRRQERKSAKPAGKSQHPAVKTKRRKK